jgi:hypothetical protein
MCKIFKIYTLAIASITVVTLALGGPFASAQQADVIH